MVLCGVVGCGFLVHYWNQFIYVDGLFSEKLVGGLINKILISQLMEICIAINNLLSTKFKENKK